MKKGLLILLLLPLIGFGQVDIEKTYYENRNLKSEITTNNGISDGLSKLYYESGKLKIVAKWNEGYPNGKWRYYNDNGQLLKISEYLNGELIEEEWL